MYQTALKLYSKVRILVSDHRAELDEKALLITFFVLVGMVGLTSLGTAVSANFSTLAGKI